MSCATAQSLAKVRHNTVIIVSRVTSSIPIKLSYSWNASCKLTWNFCEGVITAVFQNCSNYVEVIPSRSSGGTESTYKTTWVSLVESIL